MNKEDHQKQLAEFKDNIEQIQVPLIKFNYPVQVNPNFFEGFTYYSRWLAKYVDSAKYYESNLYDFFAFCAYAYAKANTKQLVAASQVFCWVLGIDDFVLEKFKTIEEGLKYSEQFLTYFDNNDKEGAKKFCLYCYLCIESFELIQESFSPAQRLRYRNEIKDFLEGTVESVSIRKGKASLDEYMLIRRRDNAAGMFIMLAEAFCGCDMSMLEQDPKFKLYFDSVNYINSWINDLYSYNREQKASTDNMNLVTFIKQNEKISAQQAANKVSQLLGEWIQTYNECRKTLIEKYSWNYNIKEYVEAMDDLVTAINQFMIYSNRYASHNSSFNLIPISK